MSAPYVLLWARPDIGSCGTPLTQRRFAVPSRGARAPRQNAPTAPAPRGVPRDIEFFVDSAPADGPACMVQHPVRGMKWNAEPGPCRSSSCSAILRRCRCPAYVASAKPKPLTVKSPLTERQDPACRVPAGSGRAVLKVVKQANFMTAVAGANRARSPHRLLPGYQSAGFG